MVCRCLVCSASACCGCSDVFVLVSYVLLLQQEPKTNLGIGGMKVFCSVFQIDFQTANRFDLFPNLT